MDTALKVLRDEILKLILKQVIGSATAGTLKFKVAHIIVSYLFDLYILPILKEAYKEGRINEEIRELRKKIIKYEKASTRSDRIDRFDELN